jgi:hypothetical protein
LILNDLCTSSHFIKQAQACRGERNTEVFGSLFTKLSTGMIGLGKKSLVYRDLAKPARVLPGFPAALHDDFQQ